MVRQRFLRLRGVRIDPRVDPQRLFGILEAAAPAERGAALSAYGSGDTAGRAAALRSVIESRSVFNGQYNAAFVLMQYFGYFVLGS